MRAAGDVDCVHLCTANFGVNLLRLGGGKAVEHDTILRLPGNACLYERHQGGNAVGVFIVPAKPNFRPGQICIILGLEPFARMGNREEKDLDRARERKQARSRLNRGGRPHAKGARGLPGGVVAVERDWACGHSWPRFLLAYAAGAEGMQLERS